MKSSLRPGIVGAFILAICLLPSVARADSIAGFWKWNDGQMTVIYPDGTFSIEGETDGKYSSTGPRSFILVNKAGYTDELQLSEDGKTLTGVGFKTLNPSQKWKMNCQKITGDPICGFWKWNDGQTAVIKPNGKYELKGEANGTWTKGNAGAYTFVNSAGYTDILFLSNNGNSLTGKGFKTVSPDKTWSMNCRRIE